MIASLCAWGSFRNSAAVHLRPSIVVFLALHCIDSMTSATKVGRMGLHVVTHLLRLTDRSGNRYAVSGVSPDSQHPGEAH